MLDAALASQAAFREIMDAMARPGLVGHLSMPEAPDGLPAGLAAVAQTLCDFETPVWLAPNLRWSPIIEWLRLETGAPLVDDPKMAAFAFGSDELDEMPLDAFACGTPAYPDRSTTIVLAVATLDANAPAEWMLSGPGIDGAQAFPVHPAPHALMTQRDALRGSFPCGIDFIFVCDDRIACLPRSTHARKVGSAPCMSR